MKITTKPPNCLNCNHPIDDHTNFCPNCGQKALPDHLTFKYFFQEFVNNIFSFDSRLLITIKYLVLKPSFLSKEFIAGHRIGYINPIQLFMLASFLYFFVNSFMFLKETTKETDIVTFTDGDQIILVDSVDIEQVDSLFIIKNGEDLDTINNSYLGEFLQKGKNFNSLDKESQNEKISSTVSYSVFLLMPIFALYLSWFFREKKKHYLENIIFSLHFHAFYYIAGVFFLLLDKLFAGDMDTLILNLLVIVYLLVAVKKFYNFSWSATAFRFLGLLVLYGSTVSLLLILSILVSVFI